MLPRRRRSWRSSVVASRSISTALRPPLRHRARPDSAPPSSYCQQQSWQHCTLYCTPCGFRMSVATTPCQKLPCTPYNIMCKCATCSCIGPPLGGRAERAADRPSRERGPVSRRDRGAPVSHIEKKGGRASRSRSLDTPFSVLGGSRVGRRPARLKPTESAGRMARWPDVRGTSGRTSNRHRISDNPNNCALGVVRIIGCKCNTPFMIQETAI